jgi:CAAX protease family protein
MEDSMSVDDRNQPQPEAPLTNWEKPVKKVWGGWATFGFALLIGLGIGVVQAVITVVYVLGVYSGELAQDPYALTELLMFDGTFIVISAAVQAIVGIGLVLIFIKARSNATITGYLAIRRISWKTVWLTLGVTMALVLLYTAMNVLFKAPQESDFMLKAYLNCTVPVLFWVAIVILAPLFEELVFRGFLYASWSQTRMGATGAIILLALLWAVQHVQYGWYEIFQIFLLGIVLGLLRKRTGSIWSPLLMHTAWNLLAMVQILLYVSGAIS